MENFNPEDFNPEELMAGYADLMEQAAAVHGETLFTAGMFALAGMIMFFVLAPLFIAGYVLLSIGLFTMAKKRNIENAWIAFVPFGQFYILGKLVAPLKFGETEVPNPPIVLLVAVLASFVLNFIPLIGQLIALAVFVLVLFALYRLYEMYSKNALLYTILSVIGLFPLFVFILRNKNIEDVKEEKKEDKKENEATKEEKNDVDDVEKEEEDVIEEELDDFEEEEDEDDDEKKE